MITPSQTFSPRLALKFDTDVVAHVPSLELDGSLAKE